MYSFSVHFTSRPNRTELHWFSSSLSEIVTSLSSQGQSLHSYTHTIHPISELPPTPHLVASVGFVNLSLFILPFPQLISIVLKCNFKIFTLDNISFFIFITFICIIRICYLNFLTLFYGLNCVLHQPKLYTMKP